MISVKFKADHVEGLCLAMRAFLACHEPVHIDPPCEAGPSPMNPTPLPLLGQPATEPTPRRPGRPTKAEQEARKAAAAEVKAAQEAELDKAVAEQAPDPVAMATEATAAGPAPAPIEAEAGQPVELTGVKAALMRVVETDGKGPEAAAAILKELGVSRVSMLKVEQYAALVSLCEKALA